ncbi:MAG TPA: hypothetical protein VFF73_23610 [Planctomycetota bacterium]|nr:hypothetical protein [Planctomycetota bacterium]
MRRALLVVGLVALGGCGAFRASIGVGLGLGGSVRAGPVDVGCLGGVDASWGNCYGVVGSHVSADIGLPGVARIELVLPGGTHGEPLRAGVFGPAAVGLYPFLDEKLKGEVRPYIIPRPCEVSVSLYALFLAFHFGFDPEGLAHDVARYVTLAAGRDDDDPPATLATVPTAPTDELEETPYKLLGRDDLALLESGTDVDRRVHLRTFERTVRAERSLFLASEDPVWALYQEPRVALATAPLDPATRQELAALRAKDQVTDFARALEARDPDTIGDALASYPFAPASEQAALERRRGELWLERGEVALALAAFEEALAHTSDREAALDARGRVDLVRRLADGLTDGRVSRNARSGSVDFDGCSLGASARSVWMMTREGDVAWEREDALPERFCASKVIGKASGLAILEAQASGRPWLLALDGGGNTRWRLPLPAAQPCGSAADQFYALGEGRIFVGRLDRVLAVEAATGRILWMNVRQDVRFEPESKKEAVPLDYRAPAGPPRRRPDGDNGFRIELAKGVLEVTSGRGRRVDRFLARTGQTVIER